MKHTQIFLTLFKVLCMQEGQFQACPYTKEVFNSDQDPHIKTHIIKPTRIRSSSCGGAWYGSQVPRSGMAGLDLY
jgi:hypothetical protein